MTGAAHVPTRRPRRWLLTMAVLLALTLVAAACGDDDPAAEPGPDQPGEPSPDPEPEEPDDGETDEPDAPDEPDEDVPDVVNIGIGGGGSFAYMAAYVTAGAGFLDEELGELGTRAEVIDLEGSVAGVQALLGGDVDYSATVTSTALNAVVEGADISQIVQFLDSDLVLMLVYADVEYDDPCELAEHHPSWGIPGPGSSAHVTALVVLANCGLTEDDVELLSMGHVGGATAAVENRAAGDVVWLGIPVAETFIEDGTLRPILDLYNPEVVEEVFGGSYMTSGLMVTPSFAEQHPRLTSAVVRAFERGLEFITENWQDNPDAITETLPETMQIDLINPVLARVGPGHSPDGEVSEAAMQRVIDSLRNGGFLEDEDFEFDVQRIVDNSYR